MSLIRAVLITLVLSATSFAISIALGRTSSAFGKISGNKSDSKGLDAGYVAQVVTRCNAFEYPISRGSKKDEHASMMTPRRAKTKSILAVAEAILMAQEVSL